LEEEHSQALESSANKIAVVKKELETVQQETDKLRSAVFPLIHSFFSVALSLCNTRPHPHYAGKNAAITGHFGFGFEEYSDREII